MTLRPIHRTVAVSALLVASLATAAHAQSAGDTCNDPVQFSGDGVVSLDFSVLTQPTTHTWSGQGCAEPSIFPQSDAYICWTATVDGLVEVATCNGTTMDTKLAFFDGCGCPDADRVPRCCSDDDCGKQSFLRCEVTCGERYLIMLNVSGLQPASPVVDVSFTTIGDPCDTGGPYEPITCEDCCGGLPEVTGFGGLQAISTQWRMIANDYVVGVYDLDPASLSPPGTNSLPPVYQHPDWTRDKLGTVFGCAIGGDGTMYVASTSIFYIDSVGSLGGAGSIYRLDGIDGTPSELIALPNQFSSGYPSLGNIAFECTRNVLFASNFDDGLVWSIDPDTGTALDTYRHADGLALGPAGDPADAPGYAPLGERVWAVQPVGDRLYYSVWVEDRNRPDAGRNNEVWSVGLDATGQFVAGTRQFEFATPDYAGTGDPGATSPIADLAQGPDCCLYVAERTMVSDSNSGSHASRLLVACQDPAGGWSIDDASYVIGEIPDSAAGGVAVDFTTGGSVWATADAALFGTSGQYAYGIQGTPRPGGDYTNSVQIDLDFDVNGQDKGQIGSIDVTCITTSSGPCIDLEQVGEIECLFDEDGLTGTYAVELAVTNLGASDAQYLLLPGGAASPNLMALNPALAPGQSTSIPLEVTGAPGDTLCLDVVLLDVFGEVCCSGELCLELPECDCAILDEVVVECVPGSPGEYFLSFKLINLSPDVVEHLYFLPQPGSTTTVTPGYLDIPTLPALGSTYVGPLVVSSNQVAGGQDTILIGLHNANFFECCVEPLAFQIPDCETPGLPSDLNGDGIWDGQDLAIMLAAWGTSGPGDLDGDGVVGGADLAILLGFWSP